MGDFIVGGKWYLLGGWVANPRGSDPEIYKKSGLKPKKLSQNLFQRWCLISTFNCFCFCNSFFAPSLRGCLAQLLEGAVAAQCSGRGFPSPGGMCWVLVPELTGLPCTQCETMATCDHLLQTEVTCTPQRTGWHPIPWPFTLCIPQPDQPSHHAVAPIWSSLWGTRLPEFAFGSTVDGHDTAGGLTSSHPTLAGDGGASHGSLWGPGTAALWWQPQGFSLMGAVLCTPKYQREGGRIWVVLELKADLGVMQPENMDVCTVSPSENKYR